MWHSTKCSKPYLIYFRHLKHFHQSPIVKYVYNSVSYILFLLLFSYYLLFDFQILSIHWTEILVLIIITTMLIEEIRQVK
jgi:transient receptor potential cation channel subfamily M protein 2